MRGFADFAFGLMVGSIYLLVAVCALALLLAIVVALWHQARPRRYKRQIPPSIDTEAIAMRDSIEPPGSRKS